MGLREELLSCVERAPGVTEDEICAFEEYLDLSESLNFRTGDRPEVWRHRRPAVAARCLNCGHQWVVLFLPMPAALAGQVQARSSFCLRCLEAERVALFKIEERKRPALGPVSGAPMALEGAAGPAFKSRRDAAVPQAKPDWAAKRSA